MQCKYNVSPMQAARKTLFFNTHSLAQKHTRRSFWFIANNLLSKCYGDACLLAVFINIVAIRDKSSTGSSSNMEIRAKSKCSSLQLVSLPPSASNLSNQAEDNSCTDDQSGI